MLCSLAGIKNLCHPLDAAARQFCFPFSSPRSFFSGLCAGRGTYVCYLSLLPTLPRTLSLFSRECCREERGLFRQKSLRATPSLTRGNTTHEKKSFSASDISPRPPGRAGPDCPLQVILQGAQGLLPGLSVLAHLGISILPSQKPGKGVPNHAWR